MTFQLSGEAIAWRDRARRFADETLRPFEVHAEMNEGKIPPGDRAAALVVRPILARERPAWRWWLERHHYLGCRPLVGESMGYVAFWRRQAVAVLGWASVTLHNAARDRFIGWDATTKRRRLHLVVGNVRFLMLPQACEPHLA